jgi:colanic acid/amylovoran biosynthesis protein
MSDNILMINVHSSSNAGDAALALVAVEQLQQHFPGYTVRLSMDDPDSHSGQEQALSSFFTWVKKGSKWYWVNLAWLLPATMLPALTHRLLGTPCFAFTPKRWRSLLRAYMDADLIVSKPGGFLYSSGRGLSLIVSLYTLWLATLVGKPLYILPQSIGPFPRKWERTLVGAVLAQARIIMVREEISLAQLRACGLPAGKSHVLPDLAFAFTGDDAETAATWLNGLGIAVDQKLPYLGMTIINWGANNLRFGRQAEYEAACAAAIRHFVLRWGGKVLLFPQVWGPLPNQDDRVPARRVAESLADLGDAVVAVDSPVAPGLLRSAYQFMDLFIGTRMHSNIFALSAGVPVIGIGYLPKTQGITQMLGLGEWTVGIDEVTAERLVNMLEDLWSMRDQVRAHLGEVIPTLVADAGKAGELVASDFARVKR